MHNHENLRRYLLKNAAPVGASPYDQFGFKSTVQANDFDMIEEHARQIAIEMSERGLVSLSIWDGVRECSLRDWLNSGRTQSGFFFNTTDSGFVRMRRLRT